MCALTNIRQQKKEEKSQEDYRFQTYSQYLLEKTEEIKEILRQDNERRLSDYERIYPFLDYRVKDENGNDVAKSTADSERTVSENNLSSFALGMVITYDKYGDIDVRIKEGEYKAEQSVAFREVISEYDTSDWGIESYVAETEEWETILLEKPKNRTYVFAMTEENLQSYMEDYGYTGYYTTDSMANFLFIMILIVTALAWLLPALPVWDYSRRRRKRAFSASA